MMARAIASTHLVQLRCHGFAYPTTGAGNHCCIHHCTVPAIASAHREVAPAANSDTRHGGDHRSLTCTRRVTEQIGRAAWRERVGQYVSISCVPVSLQKKKKKNDADT